MSRTGLIGRKQEALRLGIKVTFYFGKGFLSERLCGNPLDFKRIEATRGEFVLLTFTFALLHGLIKQRNSIMIFQNNPFTPEFSVISRVTWVSYRNPGLP